LDLGVLALGFALLVFGVFEAVSEDCAEVSPGKMQAQSSARAQPVLSHPSSFARCFCFCSNVKPQNACRSAGLRKTCAMIAQK
jgi:hypothetical protein